MALHTTRLHAPLNRDKNGATKIATNFTPNAWRRSIRSMTEEDLVFHRASLFRVRLNIPRGAVANTTVYSSPLRSRHSSRSVRNLQNRGRGEKAKKNPKRIRDAPA